MQNWVRGLLAIPIGVTIIDKFGYIARVDGESMSPTINPNGPNDSEYVFLNKYNAREYEVKRGEIVCLVSPKDPKQRIIKRVIGCQGDTVDTMGYKEKFIKIAPGHVWIEGDHTANSLDSNTFGPVPLGLMTAKATTIVWPPSRWRSLNSSTSFKYRKPIKMDRSNESLNS